MLRVFFFVLIATGTAIGQSQVDVQCHGLLDWTIVKPKAHLGSSPFNSQTVALNAVDGVVPGNGEFNKCAITKDYGTPEKKSLTIDLHRTYLISSIKTYLRQNHRAAWQNGLRVYVGPNNNTHEGNTQCGLAYTYQNENHGPVFNCSPPIRGRFVFLLKSDNKKFGVQVCEVAVKVVTFNQLPPLPNACSHNASLSTTVTYHCEEGYVSDGGKATSICLESGTWSYPSLYCRKPCPLPPFKYKELLLRANFRNMAALYACPYGTVQRYQIRQCGGDGKWIENLEPCEAVDCGKPDDPLYGYHRKLSSYKFKAEVEYACYYGYKLQGERKSLCQSTGNWDSPSPPTCELMRCPGFAPPESGAVQIEGRTVNDTAKFKCNSGYDLVGPETLTCKVINNGASWSHVPPTCKPKKCIRPPHVSVNGKIV
ncbi:complement decay-accelerating factor-like [Oscarella lobularis]|uniref:complement decay-accelerating factor-like n=1 Tax=Oscarella lobularis TaxID=121494 RepID=UPI003313AD20